MVCIMKIICIDSFKREGPDHNDMPIALELSKHIGELIVTLLNSNEPQDSCDFYKLVEDNHELKVFNP